MQVGFLMLTLVEASKRCWKLQIKLTGDELVEPPSPPLCWLVWSAALCVNFNSERSFPPQEEVEQKPAGTKTDVYLAASFSITVITITSSLPGTRRMLSLSESDKTIR